MKDSSVNYIVAVYLGPRRSKVMQLTRQLNVLFHIEKHLEAIKTLNISNIKRVTFVINEYGDDSTRLAVDCINKFDLSVEKKIIVRENSGFSYAAWEDALYQSKDEGFDYAFLIEDDYKPVHPNFLGPFFDKFKEPDVAFACQLWKNNHAAIANGMLSYESIREIFKERKLNKDKNTAIFDIHAGNSYEDAIYNQLNYLNYFTKNEYKCVDTSDCSSIPFLESDWDKLRTYGNTKSPIYIDINVASITLNIRTADILTDCRTINRIRNSYAEEFLHDSRTFTLDETTKWFAENVGMDKPLQYYMILINDIAIGYFRISRYSAANNSCYIGADIESRFTGFGLGYHAYTCFLPTIHIRYPNLHKVSLEVLRTNENAIKLYKKLGFEQTGVLHDEVLKNGKYVDSLLMMKYI